MSHSYSNAPSSSGGGSVTVVATSSGGRHGTSNNPVNPAQIISAGTYNISGDLVVTCSSSTPSNPKEKQSKSQRTAIARRPPPTIDNFWQNIMSDVRGINQVDAKHQALPLARIKKIMKLDENAKMIAAEAPLLFAKACEYFIQELTMRAWIHTEESKRRTLQRSDIAQAIANYDQFDFLIDIVPREDIKPSSNSGPKKESPQQSATVTTTTATPGVMTAGTVTLPVKMETAEGEVLTFGALNADALTAATTANQQQQQAQPTHATIHAPQQLQIIQQPTTTQPQQMQYFIATPDALNAAQGQTAAPQQQLQIIQQPAQPQYFITTHQPQQLILTAGPNGQFTATPAATNPAQHPQATILQNLAQQQQQPQIQLLQQVVTPSGEVTNVPIAINANQLNLLRLQMQPQATQQLLQLNTATNVPVTTTSHNVAAAQVQAHQQQQAQQQQQQQQQQQHQQQQHANATSIFINATPQAIAAVQQQTQQAQHQQQQQQQQQQQHQHINVAGATIIATDRNLGGVYRPNC